MRSANTHGMWVVVKVSGACEGHRTKRDVMTTSPASTGSINNQNTPADSIFSVMSQYTANEPAYAATGGHISIERRRPLNGEHRKARSLNARQIHSNEVITINATETAQINVYAPLLHALPHYKL
jgi:hypothetical protein